MAKQPLIPKENKVDLKDYDTGYTGGFTAEKTSRISLKKIWRASTNCRKFCSPARTTPC